MPTTVVAVVVLLVLALPGYTFQRRLRRRSPELTRSTLDEVMVILFSGVSVNALVIVLAVVVCVVLGLPFSQLTALVVDPRGYVVLHLLQVLLWSSGLLVTAVVLAFFAASPKWSALAERVMGTSFERRKRGNPHQSAWWLLFTEHSGHRVYVGCMLTDGGYIAGYLHSFSTAVTETRDRELTLRGEITYRAANSTVSAVLPRVNAVSVSAERIQLLTVTYVAQAVATSDETAEEEMNGAPS